jgi:epoxyqueuosine reductase
VSEYLENTKISTIVKEAAKAAGFELSGIATIRNYAELERFSQWIDQGYSGDMSYLERRNPDGSFRRASPAFSWARSVIVCAINYNTARPYSVQPSEADQGWISRYAWSHEDYHDSVLGRLLQVENYLKQLAGTETVRTKSYVDTGPIVERVYARYAGVGWLGKNTCLINQSIGSWLFLGVIVTSLELSPDVPAHDRCGTCTRCIDACPTQALIAPHELDSRKCISYLTIEKRGQLPEELRRGMGRQVFGCDICQDVCPWNRRAPATEKEEFQPREGLVNPALEWLAQMSEEEFRDRFRGSPVKRTKRTGLRRNALIAIGNSDDKRFLGLTQRLEDDADPVVSEAAAWASARLRRSTQVREGNSAPVNAAIDSITGPE